MRRDRKTLWLVAKSAMAVVLVAAVGWHFAKLLRSDAVWERLSDARPEYLLPAGLLYLAAHTVWGTFWVQLLRGQGADVPWLTGLRAYFVSQFGKYVPGKVWVIVLRVRLLKGTGVHPAVIAVTGVYETLTSMGVGALIGVGLLPFVGLGFEERFGPAWWVPVVALGGLPILTGVLHRLAERVAKKYRAADARPFAIPTFRLLFWGLIQDSVGWLFLGLSLWLTVRGLAGAIPLTMDVYLSDLAAVTLSYVSGFVAFVAPGGLAAREGVLALVLAPQLRESSGEAAAGVAAGVALGLRLVWTAFEVAAAGLLYWLVPPPNGSNPAEPEPALAAAEGTTP
jgi:uncharacterized membrane protein YbhN (UPF0104 family)